MLKNLEWNIRGSNWHHITPAMIKFLNSWDLQVNPMVAFFIGMDMIK